MNELIYGILRSIQRHVYRASRPMAVTRSRSDRFVFCVPHQGLLKPYLPAYSVAMGCCLVYAPQKECESNVRSKQKISAFYNDIMKVPKFGACYEDADNAGISANMVAGKAIREVLGWKAAKAHLSLE